MKYEEEEALFEPLNNLTESRSKREEENEQIREEEEVVFLFSSLFALLDLGLM